jgi:hypothetical protein
METSSWDARARADIGFVITEFFATGSQVPLLLVIADI